MTLARIFVLGVIFATPAASSFQGLDGGPPHSETPPVPRLERLEKMMEQFQSDWRKEKQVLTEKIKLSQTVTQELAMALTRTQALTENLLAENQELKTQIGEMQREMASVKQQQQHLMMKDSHTKKNVPLCRARTCLEDPENVSKVSRNETSGQIRDSVKNSKYGKSQRMSGLHPAQNSHGEGRSSRAGIRPAAVPLVDAPTRHVLKHRSEDHVLTSRSDDFGSLEVEVSQLAQAVTGLTADVQALQTSNTQLLNAQGSTFVQWGSSTCSGSAQLVYAGELGGSLHTHTGAAANPLCLSMNPVLEELKSGVAYTLIYGGEYETYDSNNNKDPVCAVCRTPHQTTIMVPGTNVCSTGWTKQYSGFLMAGYYSHAAATQFICVDSKMESEVGSQTDYNGHLLYYTKTQCGSLPCSPYVDNKVMTCVVCSK